MAQEAALTIAHEARLSPGEKLSLLPSLLFRTRTSRTDYNLGIPPMLLDITAVWPKVSPVDALSSLPASV